MIAFNCPGCGHKLTVKDEFAGKGGTCPHCKQRVSIPAAASAVAAQRKVVAAPAPPVVAPPAAPPRPPGIVATVPEPEDTPSSPEVEGAKLDFLAPAQKPDEIGRLGPYRVLKVLGAGGMGVVLQAEDPALKRSVALKVMRPELAAKETNRQRFLREAQATAAVEHPYIVHIHQVGEDRGVPFLAMPFLKGEALDKRLKRDSRPPWGEVVRIARQVAEGLAAAHKNGLIHRDIKPANIWMDADTGWVKILDFGLARSVGDDTHLTKSGTILGTPAYMAPEQASANPVDFRCDLFSLGAMLYRMLTGELPFKGHDTLSLLMALATATPKPVRQLNPAVPPPLDDLVMQMLEKDPAARPASAKAVADALAAIEGDKTRILDSAAVPRRAGGVSVPAKLLRAATGSVVWLFWLIVRLYRIPGRTGLVIKGGTGLLILVLLLLLLTKPGSDSGKSAKAPPKPPEPEKKEPEKVITNSIGMKLAFIPAGEFTMGSPDKEEKRGAHEGPQHKVRITKPFYVGVYEVKQSEYEKVMGKNQSANKAPDNPAENVIWDEAVEFCKKLSELPEEKSAGRVYRLPYEAEWEYACRAGTSTVFHYGNSLSSTQANFNGAEPYGGAEKGPYLGKTTKVGSYQPNAWGLYDMHGNVWEWCQDGRRTYTPNSVDDPKGPEAAGGSCVLRGGSFYDEAFHSRSARRNPVSPALRDGVVGFRVVLVR